ncbi:MAG: ribbon-helix-helix protein, CopG family [Acidimicrobiales bacterium]
MTIDDDIRKALDELRRERGLSTSAALNELARRGLAASVADAPAPFRQRTSSMGHPRFPVENIGEALELLEGSNHG